MGKKGRRALPYGGQRRGKGRRGANWDAATPPRDTDSPAPRWRKATDPEFEAWMQESGWVQVRDGIWSRPEKAMVTLAAESPTPSRQSRSPSPVVRTIQKQEVSRQIGYTPLAIQRLREGHRSAYTRHPPTTTHLSSGPRSLAAGSPGREEHMALLRLTPGQLLAQEREQEQA